ncbi:hypothetical protein SL003B_3315 [Polymorphum gilvum SL003B-26A1]|uniref:DUF1344 domain-containing protein n=2 Tax=Polymorphum TaxID=991903 RepID=F2IYC5_POLGS|nr:hypothetical protein SL003B_3315 [Polymorphum gilvum SL003B-26A1]
MFARLAAVAFAGLAASAALADESEGKIVRIDPETATISLSDGNDYAFPLDFYIDDLQPGMTVRVFFDVENGKKVLYDLQVEN